MAEATTGSSKMRPHSPGTGTREVARESVELDGGGPPPRSARGAGSRLRILSSIEEEDHRRVEVSHEGAC
jgi:hypothetical protein